MFQTVALTDFILGIWANHLKMSYTSDPYYVTKKWKVDPLPHQVELVAQSVRLETLRILLADDVGLGKTIMTGMIIKELIERGRINRVLIASPASLIGQWKGELFNKFGLEFVHIGRQDLDSGVLPDYSIVSVDTAKVNGRPAIISVKPWDLVVFDEAHKLSTRQDFGNTRETERYRLAKVVCTSARNILLLTATPHNGDSIDFESRLRLLNPAINCDGRSDLLNTYVQRYMVRRLKEEVKDPSGESIFPPRTVAKLEVEPTSEEFEFYSKVEEYVREYYRKANQNKIIQLALIILLRRVSSSIRAGVVSLNRRKNKIQILRDRKAATPYNEQDEYISPSNAQILDEQNVDDLLEMAEELSELDNLEDELRVITPSVTLEQLDAELLELETLINIGEYLISKSIESKAMRLAELVNQLVNIEKRKVIVFTEYKDTLQYLVDVLGSYPTVTIHGDRSREQRENAAASLFEDKAQILIATDAAGEGLNLQAASAVINYELPWNPNRLDQRLGRVHRYKQTLPVVMYNIVLKGTIEGKVVEKLIAKLEEIKKTLGGASADKVFDIVGVLADSELIRYVTSRLLEGWNPENVDGILDVMKQKAKDIMQAEHLLTSKYIEAVEDREKPPSAVSFVLAWAVRKGYHYSLDKNNITVKIGTYYQRVNEDDAWSNRGFLFAIKDYVETDRIVVSHAKGCFAKAIVVYKLVVNSQYDNNMDSKLVAIAVKSSGSVEEVPISTIYNIKEGIDDENLVNISVHDALLTKPNEMVNKIISSMANKIGIVLREEANFRMESLQSELDKKLLKIKNLMPHIQKETAAKVLKEYEVKISEAEGNAILKPAETKVIGILILECDDRSQEQVKKAVEMAGMDAVIRYEKKNERQVRDVSMYNYGYDIISLGISEVRHIEVKSFTKSGTVEITYPEWRTACEDQEKYWLYVVENALENPIVHTIKNPFKNLHVWEEVRQKIVMERRFLSNTWKLSEVITS